MVKHQVFALVLGLAVFNGIFSPLVQLVAAYSFMWAPPWLPASREAPGPNWIWALVCLVLCFPAFIRLLLMSGVAQ